MFWAIEICFCLFWCGLAIGADPYEFIPVYETHRPQAPSNWSGCSQLLLISGDTEDLEKYPAAVIDDPNTFHPWSVHVKHVEPINGPDGIARKVLIVSAKPTIEVMQTVLRMERLAGRVQIVYESEVQRSPSRMPLMHGPVSGAGYVAGILLGYPTAFVPRIWLSFEENLLLKRTLSAFKDGLSLLASATEDSTLIVFQGHHEDYRTTFFYPFSTPWDQTFLRMGLREK
jgi:hypothetical protein